MTTGSDKGDRFVGVFPPQSHRSATAERNPRWIEEDDLRDKHEALLLSSIADWGKIPPHAEGVRKAAYDLVKSGGGQDPQRHALEAALLRDSRRVRLELRAIDFAAQQLGPLEAAEKERRTEAGARAHQAVDQMNDTVRGALSLSAVRFDDPEPPAMSKASAAPFAAFLLVALAGIALPAEAVASAIAVGFLVAVLIFALYLAVGQARRARSVVALAAGSSLAFFTSCYLLAHLADPHSVERGPDSVVSIGNIALTSMTIAVTGGTLDVELNSAARVVAFIQILLTVGAAACGITWAWHRRLGPSDDRATTAPPPRDDPPTPAPAPPEG